MEVKTMEAIAAGGKITFIKKSTGELRVVNKPAQFVSSNNGVKSGRTPQPQLIVFVDTEKVGHNTISCDIRLLA
jgi:hypothetical protein